MKELFMETAQLNIIASDAGLGSVRQNKEFIVHPDAIKQALGMGEAYIIRNMSGLSLGRIKLR